MTMEDKKLRQANADFVADTQTACRPLWSNVYSIMRENSVNSTLQAAQELANADGATPGYDTRPEAAMGPQTPR